VEIRALQSQIEATFGTRDRSRGADGTFRRLVEALRTADRSALALELSDVVAWTLSIAVLHGIDLDGALERYGGGCPRCGASPCRCPLDPGAR
jgi:hypothetical protein